MEGCKVSFFKDPVRQRIGFVVKWTTPNKECVIDSGVFSFDQNALAALFNAMSNFSAQYVGSYDGCKDGFAIAEVDEANDKLTASVNEAAAKTAKTAKIVV